jgi:hypothetical protein
MTIEKFNSSVDILVKAYFDGTLRQGYCDACAVTETLNY